MSSADDDDDVESWSKSKVRGRFLDGPARIFGEHNLFSNTASGTDSDTRREEESMRSGRV